MLGIDVTDVVVHAELGGTDVIGGVVLCVHARTSGAAKQSAPHERRRDPQDKNDIP